MIPVFLHSHFPWWTQLASQILMLLDVLVFFSAASPPWAPRGPRGRADPRTKTKMSTRRPASAHSGSGRASAPRSLRDAPGMEGGICSPKPGPAVSAFPALDYISHGALRTVARSPSRQLGLLFACFGVSLSRLSSPGPK